MEDKKLTPSESMELITSMITATRSHLTKGEGNMLLFWGYLCVAVALLNMILPLSQSAMSLIARSGFLWWIIPIIGIPYTLYVMCRKSRSRIVATYSDSLTSTLWKYVLWLALAAGIIGAIFLISGFKVWYILQLFAFFVVGMAVSVQGMIIREPSMILGGAFSVLCGGFLVAGFLSGNTMIGIFSLPLFILSFIVMMIIPGHILNHKAKMEK